MNNEPITKKPLWRRILRKIFLTAIILIVLGLIVCFTWNYFINRQIKTEIQKIRAAGQPVTFEDWEAKLPKINETQNAARVYNAAMNQLLKDEDISDLQVKYFRHLNTNSLPSQDRSVMEKTKQVLEANRVSLGLLDTGCRLPACRDSIWAKGGIAGTLEKLSRTRMAIRRLSLRTLYLASQGKADEAVESAICSLQFVRIFDDQPLLITYMVKIACQAVACRDINFILQFSKPSQAGLEKLQAALAAEGNPNDFEKMILGERVYGIAYTNMSPGGNEHLPWTIRSSPFMLQANLGYLKDMAKFLEVSNKPWPQIFVETRNLSSTSVFGRILSPAYQRVIVTLGRNLAQERSTLVAIMIERYRRSHHENLPEKLADLVPAYAEKLPADPFTDKNLLYRREQNSYTIYSLGDNLKDDHGEVESPTTTQPGQETKQHNDWGVKIFLHLNK